MYYRTLTPINWGKYFEQKSHGGEFFLDFEIEAGFSFATAVAHEKMREDSGPVALDETLDVPDLRLSFDCTLKNSPIQIKSVTLKNLLRATYEATDKYRVSTIFTLNKIDFGKLEKDVARRMKDTPEAPAQSIIMVCMVEYFQEKADLIKETIISHIELSGFFAKLTPATLSLYIKNESGMFRMLQQAGGHESAGHYPIHPLSITKEVVVKNHERYSLLSTSMRRHYQKGLHYKFLGFYDEGYLCFYKLIESTFKTDKFQSKAVPSIFGIDSKQLRETLNHSNQRTMMLFIYQIIIKESSEFPEAEKANIMTKMLESSKIRNDIAHSSDQTENSKAMLPFVMSLSNMMLLYIEQ